MTEEELKHILDERAALKGENTHLKKTLIPNLERSVASIRSAHRSDLKKLESRKEQVKRLKEELNEQSKEKEKYKKMYLELSQSYKQVTSQDSDLIKSLRDETERMKDFVKSMYKANIGDAYCREYLGTILNEWEVQDD